MGSLSTWQSFLAATFAGTLVAGLSGCSEKIILVLLLLSGAALVI
jgi:hypothetical protein